MKTIANLFFILFVFTGLSAQVTLEKTINYSTSVVEFETLGYKYYLMDVPRSECRIYNLNHSLYKTISCPVPSGCFLLDIKYLSENTFDTDNGIELLYTYYRYNAVEEYYDYDSKIINEDGSELAFIDGALYNYIYKTGEGSYKMFSYCYDYSRFPEKVWTNIYSLPGVPVLNASSIEGDNNWMLKGYPNPGSDIVEITYSLPVKLFSANLKLINSSGQLVDQFVVDRHSDHLDLDVSKLSSGIYFYFIENDGEKSAAQKLVVQK